MYSRKFVNQFLTFFKVVKAWCVSIQPKPLADGWTKAWWSSRLANNGNIMFSAFLNTQQHRGTNSDRKCLGIKPNDNCTTENICCYGNCKLFLKILWWLKRSQNTELLTYKGDFRALYNKFRPTDTEQELFIGNLCLKNPWNQTFLQVHLPQTRHFQHRLKTPPDIINFHTLLRTA